MKTKIKVLEYIAGYSLTGEVEAFFTLIKNLNKKQFIVDAVCPEGPAADYLKSQSPESYGVRFKTIKAGGRGKIFFLLLKLIWREKYHLVHIHSVNSGGIAGRLAAKMAGAKIIVTESGLAFSHSWIKSRFLIFFHLYLLHPVWNTLFLDRIIAISQAVYEATLKRERLNSKKLSLIYYGIELNNFSVSPERKKEIKKEWGIDEDSRVIGSVCRLVPQKGISYLIEAFSRLGRKNPQLKFLIVGEGSSRSSLEKQCKESGITDKVIFTGWRRDIPEMISVMDIFVLPSIYEPFGLAVLEAMASGKPVIASRTGGLVEIIEHKKTGILVFPQDINGLAGEISCLLRDKELSLRMGRAAQESVREKFSARVMTDKIERLYQELLKGDKN